MDVTDNIVSRLDALPSRIDMEKALNELEERDPTQYRQLNQGLKGLDIEQYGFRELTAYSVVALLYMRAEEQGLLVEESS